MSSRGMNQGQLCVQPLMVKDQSNKPLTLSFTTLSSGLDRLEPEAFGSQASDSRKAWNGSANIEEATLWLLRVSILNYGHTNKNIGQFIGNRSSGKGGISYIHGQKFDLTVHQEHMSRPSASVHTRNIHTWTLSSPHRRSTHTQTLSLTPHQKHTPKPYSRSTHTHTHKPLDPQSFYFTPGPPHPYPELHSTWRTLIARPSTSFPHQE